MVTYNTVKTTPHIFPVVLYLLNISLSCYDGFLLCRPCVLFGLGCEYESILVAVCNVHNLHYLTDGYTLVGVE